MDQDVLTGDAVVIQVVANIVIIFIQVGLINLDDDKMGQEVK